MSDTVEVRNVNHPSTARRVDRAKYEAMRKALLGVLPSSAPGMSVADALSALKPHLPEDLFPGGKTSGWWQKTVQLDLEAKGEVGRTEGRPLRIYRIGKAGGA